MRSQAVEQFEDIGTGCHIERRQGLLQRNQIGLDDERAGAGNTLALVARDFMRLTTHNRARQPL